MRHITASTFCIGLSVCAVNAPAGQPGFTVLTLNEAADVTVDEFAHTQVLLLGEGKVWIQNMTVGGITYVGDGTAHRMSADGTTIAGAAFNVDDAQEAVKWTVGGSLEWLGALPDAFECTSLSNGYATSGDGSVFVGLSWAGGCSGRAFRWTAEEAMTELEPLGDIEPPIFPGLGGNRASVISDDGQVIAGFAQGTFNRTPAVWNASDNSGWLLDVDAEGEIGAINSDGTVLAGQYLDDTMTSNYLEPFYWTERDGVVIIPSLPEYPGGHVLGVSDDGKTLVGFSGTVLEGRAAIVWRPEWGTVELKAKLIELDISVPELFVPMVSRGVTDDGRTVVGWGVLLPSIPDETAVLRGFVAELPPQVDPPCPADLDGNGQVGFGDLTLLLAAWGTPDADIDNDGTTGFSDLTGLLNAWGPCV